MDRTDVTQLRPEEVAARAGAKASLRYPAVSLTAGQIVTIAEAFSDHCLHNNYTLWACSILPEHTSRYRNDIQS
ncbi:MAG: hypothetical protein R3C53_00315 [Pirellulaceae bacterium]